MFSAHLGQPSEGQLCAKAELMRPLVVTQTPFLIWPRSRPRACLQLLQGEPGFQAEASISWRGLLRSGPGDPTYAFSGQKLPTKAE